MAETDIEGLVNRAAPAFHRDTPRLAADVAKRAVHAGLALDGSDDEALVALMFSVFEVRRVGRYRGRSRWLPSAAAMPELLDVARRQVETRDRHAGDPDFFLAPDSYVFFRCLDAAGLDRPHVPTPEERVETERELAAWAAHRAAVLAQPTITVADLFSSPAGLSSKPSPQDH